MWPMTTIALVTDADRSSRFAREADERYDLGPVFVQKQSGTSLAYLDHALLERALVHTRASAAWVGWGFVAEQAEFAELCQKLGVVFIGPSPEAMRLLGDKIGAKNAAEKASVPVSPWSKGPVEDLAEAARWAEQIGFPIMLKATAGGGGRGVRRVTSAAALSDAFQSASQEAAKAFGDGTLYIERAISQARHVEVQIVADQHGTIWPLGLRDCSLQRRNQKVIEEAPAPALPAAHGEAILAAAARLAREARYTSLGTAEFLYVPENGAFYFMEMNTRLQVEHTVTELTTGVDLVELQLRIAAGEELPEAIPETRGHAIEARLNAEDPERDFAPSPGKLLAFRPPTGLALRCDTGYVEGDTVPSAFDSMTAKLIAWGRDRDEARGRLERAIEDCLIVIERGASNRTFLAWLLSQPDVRANNIDIGWIDRTWASNAGDRRVEDIAFALAAIELCEEGRRREIAKFRAALTRGRMSSAQARRTQVKLRAQGLEEELWVLRLKSREHVVEVRDRTLTIRQRPFSRYQRIVEIGGETHKVTLASHGQKIVIEIGSVRHVIDVPSGDTLDAPAPGVVVSVAVQLGQAVRVGDIIVVLEAMKTEMPIRSPLSGHIDKIHVAAGVQVAPGAPLVSFQREAGEGAGRRTLQVDHWKKIEASHHLSAEQYLELAARVVSGEDLSESEQRQFEIGPLVLSSSADFIGSILPIIERAAEICRLFALRLPTHVDADAMVDAETAMSTISREGRAALQRLPAQFREAFLAAVEALELDDEGADEDDRLGQELFHLHRAASLLRATELSWARLIATPHGPLSDAIEARWTKVLDVLLMASRDSLPHIQRATRQVRYLEIEAPRIAALRERALEQTRRVLDGFSGETIERNAVEMTSLVAESAQPVFGLVLSWAENDPSRAALAHQIYLRRFYGTIGEIRGIETLTRDELCCTRATVTIANREAIVFMTNATQDSLDRALAALKELSGGLHSTNIYFDIFIQLRPGESVSDLSQRLNSSQPKNVVRCCMVLWERDRVMDYRTFSLASGSYSEVEQYRRIHPMTAGRLELWRMREFETARLPSSEDVFVFSAIARSNPDDRRLFAFINLRDWSAELQEKGEITLPGLNALLGEATTVMRNFLLEHPTKTPTWNRIVIHVWNPPNEIGSWIGAALNSASSLFSNLFLEKVVVRAGDLAYHYGFEGERFVRMRAAQKGDLPIRPLTPYRKKVLRLRQRGFTYPYEILRMLTQSVAGGPAPFPPGEFQEYDLAPAPGDGLIPVSRPAGENTCGVVVGLISNFTPKHPEGMQRVIILGDPSHELGALAEPECRRIIAALNLAHELRVPLEWFAVSAGAAITMNSGTENLDWTARVLRRIVELTDAGLEINVIVDAVNVGAQAYWNAEATMLMHTRGVLIVTRSGALVLTGKKALEFSGGVSAPDNLGIGGFERIMGPNGEAQIGVKDLGEACGTLFSYYEHTYVAPGARWPRRKPDAEPAQRDISPEPYGVPNEHGFSTVGDLFSSEKNAGRKKPFDVRAIMRAVIDKNDTPLERWAAMRHAEMAIVWETHIAGYAACVIGIDAQTHPRLGWVPADGPESWSGSTLFPMSSKKVARAINAASGRRPVVFLANLSGFDGSPESLRRWQLELGAEIGRAIVHFSGPSIFCVLTRCHGGAYVVFSKALNEGLEAAAVEGAYASVIGGAPAAAVVFRQEVRRRVLADRRYKAASSNPGQDESDPARVFEEIEREKLTEVAEEFDRIHSIERARQVGSIDRIVSVAGLRGYIVEAMLRSGADSEPQREKEGAAS